MDRTLEGAKASGISYLLADGRAVLEELTNPWSSTFKPWNSTVPKNHMDESFDVLKAIKFEEFCKAIERSVRNSKKMKKAWENPSADMILASLLALDKAQAAVRQWWIEHPEEAVATTKKGLSAANQWHEEYPEDSLACKELAWAAAARWREENPEKMRVITEKGWIASAKWRQENPEEFRAQGEKARATFSQWCKDHPEEARSIWRNGLVAMQQWRKDHPEEARTNGKKGAITLAQWKQENRKQNLTHAEKARAALVQKAALKALIRFQIIKPFIAETGTRLRELRKLLPDWTKEQLIESLRRAVQRGDVVRVEINCKEVYYFLT